MSNWKLALWVLLVVVAVLGTSAVAANLTTTKRNTIIDQLCPGYTIDVGSAVLCMEHHAGPLKEINPSHLVGTNSEVLLWYVQSGKLVKVSQIPE